jgi:UDP-N-acetylmuramate dehydrogenase
VADLTSFNTLRIPAKAQNLIEIHSVDQLQKEITAGSFQNPFIILGHGANVLFTKDFPGTVFIDRLTGKKIISQTDSDVTLEIAGGEDWPELVSWTVSQNFAGIENLALIPGTVGSAPYQNIAAYGQTFADVFISLNAINLTTGKIEEFSKTDCQFHYRESVFKRELKNKYFITTVTLKLAKINPKITTGYYSRYESLETELTKFAHLPYTIKDIYQAVINLRSAKLPDWTKIGTAGSFFKNPFVTKKKLSSLQSQISDLQFYPTTNMDYPHPEDPVFDHTRYVKIPVGRLLDELGWRGKRIGNVGTYEKHALIIVAYPGATGPEVYEFSERMRADVQKAFGINLEYEVVVI